MAGLEDLLLYKEKVALKNPKTGKIIKTVWVRVLGDEELKEAFRFSRIASAKKREALRNPESTEYKDEILGLAAESKENLEEWVLTSKENIFANSAPVVVPREDLPEIEEIAAEPDAPTLEEQERLDSLTDTQNDKYVKAIDEYVQTKINEVKAELADITRETLVELAAAEYINIQSLQAFMDELNQQKAYRGTFLDEQCEKRGYSTYEGFLNAASAIKKQLIEAYSKLEMGNDEVKK